MNDEIKGVNGRRGYYDLLKAPAADLSKEELKRLEQAAKIPCSARRIVEGRVTELTRLILEKESEIFELRKERSELQDWLDGYDELPF